MFLWNETKLKKLLCAALITAVFPIAAQAGNIKCGADTTGSGAITQVADCNPGTPFPYGGVTPTQTVANSNLCPINQTSCSMSQYRCPEDNNIYSDNTTCNTQCIKTESCSINPFSIPASNCPTELEYGHTGAYYDAYGDQYSGYMACMAVPVCPSGSVFEPNLDKCIITPTCPTGDTFINGVCIKSPPCSPGYYYDFEYGACVTGSTCPAGTTLKSAVIRGHVGEPDTSVYYCEGGGYPSDPSCPIGSAYNPDINKCESALDTVQVCVNRLLYIRVYKSSNTVFHLQYLDTSGDGLHHKWCEPPTFIDPATGTDWHTVETIDLTSSIPPGTIDQWDANVKFCIGWHDYTSCVTSLDDAVLFGKTWDYGAHSPVISYYYKITQTANQFICPFDSSLSCAGAGTSKTCSKQSMCSEEPVCPVSYNCNCTNGTTPTCPNNGIFDPNQDACLLSTGNLCPSGTTWNSSADGCVSMPVCENGQFNAETNFCEAPLDITCPSPEYSYNSVSKMCEVALDCPSGTSYDSASHKCTASATPVCPAGYTYDLSTQKCYVSSGCAASLSLNISTDRCETAPSCSLGTAYNATTNMCDVSPVCPQGSSYNTVTNRCEVPPTSTPTCPPGYAYDSVNQKCYISSACGSPGSPNTSTDRCETSLLYSCSSGAYDSSSGSCLYTPVCSSPNPPYGPGTLSGSRTVTCPAGGTLIGSTPLCQVAGTWVSGWPSRHWNCPYQNGVYSYTYAGSGQCQLQLSCPSGTTYNSSTHECVLDAPLCASAPFWFCAWGSCTAYCGSGYQWNLGVYTCTATNSCPAGSTFRLSLNKCVSSPTVYCPADYTNSGGVCIQSLTCPQGSSYNTVTDRCEVAISYTPTCPGGYSYDALSQKCYIPTTCSVGIFNSSTDRCETTSACPQGASLNTVADKCDASPICPEGSSYNSVTDRCEVAPTFSCPSGTTYDALTGGCSVALVCPSSGALTGSTPLCQIDANFNCPSGYAPDNGVCRKVVSCTHGDLDANISMCKLKGTGLCPSDWAFDPDTENCRHIPVCTNSTYDPANNLCCTCASNNPCVATTSSPTRDDYYCSPSTCVDITAPGVNQPDQADLSYLQNDLGFSSNDGSCSGLIYIFTGRPYECRPPGTQTLSNDCCENPTGSVLGIGGICNQNELMASAMTEGGLCHYVGNYCAEKWEGVGCVQKKKVYCCFDSKLARIVQEQGRQQLIRFNQFYCPSGDYASCLANNTFWNTPEVPDCVGFKPEELQMLNWSKIDLSEYFTDIQNQLQSTTTGLQSNMTDQITNFYNQIK